jgi:hypothetical protein
VSKLKDGAFFYDGEVLHGVNSIWGGGAIATVAE